MTTPVIMTTPVEMLHTGNHSLVVSDAGGNITTYNGHGVSDLHRLLKHAPYTLRGAYLADKVIGKGAAALIICGEVKSVYADTISTPALTLLQSYGIPVEYAREVPNIINRKGDGICPVETLCLPCTTPQECLPLIDNFINSLKQK